jgi:serine/threonine-protein kinase
VQVASAQDATALEAGPAPAPPSAPSRPPSAPAGRFAPGEVLAGRYRIVGPVGSGGMGEVYRADDLKLGQAVALKFLPKEIENDAIFLERFHGEVRLARQIAHPSVCRVYDIVNADGRHFLTMEYVDGEDLASLLRRIGQLPEGKALDVARQLCAGLAAIHERGVLHRDLKPANVMLDGHGRVRITDFGLALAAGEGGAGEVAGTPAYMAPEQFEGKPPTVQTDLYALGLIMYEAYTGKRAFEASSFKEWQLKHSSTVPTAPSELDDDVEAAVDRAILRCLEKDPARRPSSARALAASLPGGDPLAAALAAGETPSPEMVAAAGGEGALAPRTAWSLLAVALGLVLGCVAMAPYSSDFGLSRTNKSPEVLRDRARELVARLGYGEHAADTAGWLVRDYLPMRYLSEHDVSTVWRRAMDAWGPPFLFSYRQSPRLMVPVASDAVVTEDDPALTVSGMVSLQLDSRGRLRRFEAVPPQREPQGALREGAPWTEMFEAAALNPTAFAEVGPEWVPTQPYDARREWTGPLPWSPRITARVAAAAFHGRPVYFEVLGPWSVPTRMEEFTPGGQARRFTDAAFAFTFLVLFVSALVFARRNLRAGRAHRRGALALAGMIVGLEFYCWVWRAHHVASLSAELDGFFGGMAFATVGAAVLVLIYLALEPYVRRTVPELLIAWTRIAEGRPRDPRVGRDLLVGGMAGCAGAFALHLGNAIPAWIAVPGQTTMYPTYAHLVGLRGVLLELGRSGVDALFEALFVLGLLFVLRLALRRTWLAGIALVVVLAATRGWGENPLLDGIAVLGIVVPIAVVATRYGLVASFAASQIRWLVIRASLPFDPEQWYFGGSIIAAVFVVALLAMAFRVSLGGRPVFGPAVDPT